jgi:hypothetical protein
MRGLAAIREKPSERAQLIARSAEKLLDDQI